ncbi:MAG: substrate-binding domain-containing protein [Planctomycetes bacterium]|nr:substrate-binding domain-containing protein [Planctomycetota bacterium]
MGRRQIVTAWKSGLLLVGTAVSALILHGVASTGYGLGILITGLLLWPLLVLENVYGLRHDALPTLRWFAFPLVMFLLAILHGAYDYPAALRVWNQEYWEVPSRHVYENKPEPQHFPEVQELVLTAVPRMDGSSSLAGLYGSVGMFLNNNAYSSLEYSQTHEAYLNLVAGRCDIVFAFHPSGEEMAEAERAGVPFILTPVGREAFVFINNAANPVEGLTSDQLRAIYSGEITRWNQVGGLRERIIPFQRRKTAGAKAGWSASWRAVSC